MIESYPDVVYFSLPKQGISYLFEPTGGYRPKYSQTFDQLDKDKLCIASVDLYNVPSSQSSSKRKQTSTRIQFDTLSVLPVTFDFSNFENINITADTTAKELVDKLGEPDRKGSSDGLWIEWENLGLHVEFGLTKDWDTLQKDTWTRINLFKPGVQKGKDEDDMELEMR